MLPQKAAMQVSSTLVAFASAALTALAFWADGASVGTVVTSATLIGAAVLFTAKRASSAWVSVVIGFIYLGAVSFISVAASLIDKATDETSNDQIFNASTAIISIGLGWTICDIILRKLAPTA